MEKVYRRDRKNKMSMIEVRNEAQKIAFAPMIFQAVNAMMEFGLIELLNQSENGLSKQEAVEKIGISEYAVGVLFDTALYTDIITQKEERFFITRIGKLFADDELTIKNFRFVNDVCYQGVYCLKESLKSGSPEGLKQFGSWDTVYQGLCNLPEKVQKSWFEFDNYYSDYAFDDAIEILLKNKPSLVYDVGGNTGKFGISILSMDKNVKLAVFDLAPQLEKAKANINKAGFGDRSNYIAIDVLSDKDLPKGADIIWMSQFLDCFSPEKIVFILQKAAKALKSGGKIYILEPFIDAQQTKPAALSLAGTSLYFTAIANGYSKIYNQYEMVECVEKANLKVTNIYQNIGFYDYTLIECTLK